jgi:hypothetical protein
LASIAVPEPMTLHPRMHEIYKMNVENLINTFQDSDTVS